MPLITDDGPIELEAEYPASPDVPCPDCGDDARRSVENDLVYYNHSDGRTCTFTITEEEHRRGT